MIIVTGGAGFIGSAIIAALNTRAVTDILVVDELAHDIGVAGMAGLLVLCEPDFGTAVLIGTLCSGVMLVCGARPLYMMVAFLCGLPLLHKLVIDEKLVVRSLRPAN